MIGSFLVPSALCVKLHECQFERKGIISRTNTFSLQEYRYKSTVKQWNWGPRFLPFGVVVRNGLFTWSLGNICWTSTKMYTCILSEIVHLLFVFTVAETIVIITWQHYEKTLEDKVSIDNLLMKLVSEDCIHFYYSNWYLLNASFSFFKKNSFIEVQLSKFKCTYFKYVDQCIFTLSPTYNQGTEYFKRFYFCPFPVNSPSRPSFLSL